MNMEERPSQVIEEYLLVLYKLQRDGEKALGDFGQQS